MSEREVAMMPLVQLPSGVMIRADQIMFIARQEINQYVAFMAHMPRSPILTGSDIDALREMGAIQGMATKDVPTEEPSKLVGPNGETK